MINYPRSDARYSEESYSISRRQILRNLEPDSIYPDDRYNISRNQKKNILKIGYSRKLKKKYEAFLRNLKEYSFADKEKFEMTVRRNHITYDSFQIIGTTPTARHLRRKLWVSFLDEPGLDYGGVSREWFHNLTMDIFDPYYGLFEYSTDSYTLQINPCSALCHEDHLLWFQFIGRVVGLAVFHKKLINATFIRPIYSTILGKTATLADLKFVDIEFSNSLQWILDNDPECLSLTYEVEEDVFGERVIKELIPRGSNIAVTEKNKHDYIRRVIHWRLVERVQEQMESFLRGFYDIVPAVLIGMFN